MNAVAYYRYSSHSQNEQSIEGQKRAVENYAAQNGYTIIKEYPERALSGTTDKRPKFQRMLSDSAKQRFEVILVYSLDRFARNRYDSATHKAHLKKHGVRVISVTESISQDPVGIMVEGFLESMAEYYSAELSQKVKRGISLSVEQCKFIGGYIPLGYTVDENKHYQFDPATAPVVKKIFELYAAGSSITQINDAIIEQFGKAYFGNISNSINRILDNRNYKGIYTRGGAEVEGGMPRIITDELFERVAQMRAKKERSKTSTRNDAEYLLTTKIFCGYHERDEKNRVMMVGVSGTSKSGKIHNYYTCKSVWNKKGCKKKTVRKDYIENFLLEKAREQLTDDNILYIAKVIAEKSKQENNTPVIADLKKRLKDNKKAIDNLMLAIESGEHIELLSEQIGKRKQEKADLEKALAREQYENIEITEDDIGTFLYRLKMGDENDIKYKRALIAIFINAVYLYDDKATIFFNTIDRTVEVDYNILNDADGGGEQSSNSNGLGCSNNQPPAPPRGTKANVSPMVFCRGDVRVCLSAGMKFQLYRRLFAIQKWPGP